MNVDLQNTVPTFPRVDSLQFPMDDFVQTEITLPTPPVMQLSSRTLPNGNVELPRNRGDGDQLFMSPEGDNRAE